MSGSVVRSEYPRPQWRREAWHSLNGAWDFAFDDADAGLRERWVERTDWPLRITVPFACESAASGIGDTAPHPIVWYRRTFQAPAVPEDGALWIHFGAVDYAATVWLNGVELGTHRGGHVPFAFDAAPHLQERGNTLVVRVEDAQAATQPRGKQAWDDAPGGIFYHRTTGIWQSVWLEPVGALRLERVDTEFAREPNGLIVRPTVHLPPGVTHARLHLELERAGATVAWRVWDVGREPAEFTLPLPADLALWSPEAPVLHEAVWRLDAPGEMPDVVHAELGFRTIEAAGDELLLNGEPYEQRLVLVQGYWPDGYYTAPNVEAMQADVEAVAALGFNGLRMHQKIEDPWFLTLCDRAGLLVWEEMPSALLWTPELGEALRTEFLAAIARDINHPCVVAWVPYNESWGVLQLREEPDQLADVVRAYEAVRARDPSRPVVANSGFFQSVTDICDPHDYAQDAEALAAHLACFGDAAPAPVMADFDDAPLFVEGYRYAGQPVVVSEYGGVGFHVAEPPPGGEAFGYGRLARNQKDFAARIAALTEAVRGAPRVSGFCYTQLYDVEYEINGLLTFEREYKVRPERLRRTFGG